MPPLEHYWPTWDEGSEADFHFRSYGVEHRGVQYHLRDTPGNGARKAGDLIARIEVGRIADLDLLADAD
jgi:hypothetical protein